jgi:hypothetical protein
LQADPAVVYLSVFLGDSGVHGGERAVSDLLARPSLIKRDQCALLRIEMLTEDLTRVVVDA